METFFAPHNAPECPIIRDLHKKGEFLKVQPCCDRTALRGMRPKTFGLFFKLCHFNGTCLITDYTMGKGRDEEEKLIPLDIRKRNLANYYRTHTWYYKTRTTLARGVHQTFSFLVSFLV